MSSDANELTKEREITVERYSKTKFTHYMHRENLLMEVISYG